MPFIQTNAIVMHFHVRGQMGKPRVVLINSLGTDFRI